MANPRKLLTMLLCILFTATQVLAQTRTVTGTVTDDKGNPLSNASVQVKDSKLGVTTNVTGTFSISNVPASAKTLIISSINFTTQEVSITANNTVTVSLIATGGGVMDEVVVVGYGSGKKRSDIAGSVAVVGFKELENRPTPNVLDALQGQVAGLQVYSSSGEPTATPSVRLNGVNSLGANSTPLYVLDGIPIEASAVLSLNPNDFESITTLKDASSTAIYGSRAANGVILITSKKGKVNSSRINVSAQYATSNLTGNTVKMFNSFMNTKELTDFQLATGQFTSAQVATRVAAGYTADTKWYKEYYKQNVPAYQADLSFSGGGGKTTYFISGGYLNQEGLAYRSGYKRYTLRSNVQSTLNNWLQLGMNLLTGYDDRKSNPFFTNSLDGGLSVLLQPYYSPRDANGNRYQGLMAGVGRYDPLYYANNNLSPQNKLKFNPSTYIQITPAKGLTLKSQAGFDFYDFRATAIRMPSYVGSPNNGSTAESFERSTTRTITNTAEYKFNVGDQHSFTILAGQEFINNTTTGFAGSSTGQTDDRLTLVSAGPTGFAASSYKIEYAFLSYFGRLNYSLNDKYYVDLSIRNDQSSKFGKDLRSAMFYSGGFLWKAKKENFLSDVNWLNDLEVRASYGTSGNSLGSSSSPLDNSYDALATVGTGTYNAQTGWAINQSGNPLLSWEIVKQANFGIQATVLKKLGINVEFYKKVTKDMLINVPYAFTSGFSSVRANVGSLTNSGVNLSLNYTIINTKKANLVFSTNVGYTSQKVTELFQGKKFWVVPNTGISWSLGEAVTYFYPIFSRINPTTGLPEWFKPNADPNKIVNTTKDTASVTTTFNTAALQQNTGIKRYAPFTGGFGLSGSFQDLYFSADFAFAQGKYIINNDQYFTENPSVFSGYNQTKNVLNYWKNPGDVALYPKYGTQFSQFDSRLIQDASFMRLKNLTVGYNLPKSLLSKIKVISSSTFYITFRNILTITKYKGPDPEVDSNIGLGTNPNTKQTAVGFKLQF